MGLEIRPFTLADVPFGLTLTDAEGWARTREDWARLVRVEPQGALKAVLDGRDVGTTAAVAFGPLAWIHSVIVSKEFRGHGIGVALMRACLDRLWSQGIVAVKLDSVSGVEPFYERLGFRREYPSIRFLRDGLASPGKAAPLRTADWRDVFLFDRKMTGLDRGRVLQAILRDNPYESFLRRDRGDVRGFVLTRRGPRRSQIGPLVVADGDAAVASDLLRAALDTAPSGKFRACVGDFNREAVALFESLGFTRGESSTRMVLGEPFQESTTAFAMISAEKG